MSDLSDAFRSQLQTRQIIRAILDVYVNLIRLNVGLQDDTVTTILGGLNNAVDEIEAVIRLENASILEAIKKVLGDNSVLFEGILRQAVGDIQQTVETSVAVQEKSNEKVRAELGKVGTVVNEILTVLGDGIDVEIQNVIDLDERLITGFTRQLQDFIAGQSAIVANQQVTFKQIIDNVIDTFLESIRIDANADERALIDIAEAILRNGDISFGSDGGFIKWAEGEFAKSALPRIWEVLSEPIVVIGEKAVGSIYDIAEAVARDNDEAQVCVQDITDALPDDPVLRVIVGGIVSALQAATVPIALAQQRGQPCLQADGFKHPWAILSPGDIVDGFNRRILTEQESVDELKRNGFSEGRIRALLALGKTLPDINFIFSAWFRNLIDEESTDATLAGLGFNDGWISVLKRLAFFIPPPQDLITMAVREVFSPEIARRQGQFDDFPEEFAFWGAQQGISREWAENYWAAHWALPSVQMGYEMLHRRVISESKLKGLMQSLDIMPGWRDELIQISYSPYTRVDIRRMHALGILDEGEVTDAYMDIGYDRQRAEQLTAFTVELNQDEDVASAPAATDLTRANIIQFYKRGVITRSQARSFMIDAGINEAAADLWLTNTDLEAELKERDQEIDIILDEFRVDKISYDRAQDLLQILNIEPAERQEALLQLRKIQISKHKLPGIEDLNKMISAELIDDATFIEVLEEKGWEEVWAQRYLNLAKQGTP